MKNMFSIVLCMICAPLLQAQNVAINNSNAAPHASAMLDVQSTTKGMLVPRMTSAQRAAIVNPAHGLLLYDTDFKGFMYYNGIAWTAIGGGGGNSPAVFAEASGAVFNTGDTANSHFVFGRSRLPLEGESINDRFLFFDKAKGALRAGLTTSAGLFWQPDQVGKGSVAFGEDNVASGDFAFAIGNLSEATGINSLALGRRNRTRGGYSIAVGKDIRSNGSYTAAFGEYTVAHAAHSVAMGRYNDSITGSNVNNWVETDPLLTIGNGTSNENRRNALTLLKNGNMGLGTNAPQTLMHLRKNSFTGFGQLILEESNDVQDGSRITFKNSGAPELFWDLYGYTGSESVLPGTAKFNFNASGIRDVMTLTGIGFVGIGNNNPSAGLDITTNASASFPQARLRVNTNDFVRLRMSNTVNPNPYWDIASQTSGITPGNARMNFFYSHTGGGGTDILSLHGSGNAILAGALTQNSDARLKQNIEPIKDAAALISQLSGYHYQWKDDWRDQGTQTGLLAQEVEKLMPELVKEDDKGVKSVNYNGLIPYLLEAIKAQQKQIDVLMQKMETSK